MVRGLLPYYWPSVRGIHRSLALYLTIYIWESLLYDINTNYSVNVTDLSNANFSLYSVGQLHSLTLLESELKLRFSTYYCDNLCFYIRDVNAVLLKIVFQLTRR